MLLLLFHPCHCVSGIVTTWAVWVNLQQLLKCPSRLLGETPTVIRATRPCAGAQTRGSPSSRFLVKARGPQVSGCCPSLSGRWQLVLKIAKHFYRGSFASNAALSMPQTFENSGHLDPHVYSPIMNLTFYLVIRVLRVKNI